MLSTGEKWPRQLGQQGRIKLEVLEALHCGVLQSTMGFYVLSVYVHVWVCVHDICVSVSA